MCCARSPGSLVVEAAVMATEVPQTNRRPVGLVCDLMGEPTFVPHEEFKRASAIAGAFDRTGEASPFANVIVHSAVPF
jgi:D-ribose pyranase